MTTTFRRGSDFRAYVQDSLAAQGKAPPRQAVQVEAAPVARFAGLRTVWRARIDALLQRLPGVPKGAALRARLDAATASLAGFSGSAHSFLRRRPGSGAVEDSPSEAVARLRARRVQARQQDQSARQQDQSARQAPPETPGARARKLTLEESRREIEAVQARLDAIAAPPNPQENWAAELAREYRQEFHPVDAARKPAPAQHESPTAADGAAAAIFLAGQVAWRIGRLLEPAVRFISVHSAPILKIAAVALAIVGAGGLLAQWPQGGQDEAFEAATAATPARPAAQRSAWLDIQKPFRVFDLGAPQLAHEKRLYTARRHSTGGGREDVLTFGEFAGSGPFLRLSVYRHGSEKSADAAFFVDMARRAAQLGLSLGRANFAETQATRFGDAETAAMTMTEGRVTRENCRGFRASATQLGLTLAGFACGAGDEEMSGADLACLVNRLDLLSAGDDRPLRDFFAAAQARGSRGCMESAVAPSKKRPNEAKGLQENRAGGLF